MRKTAVLPALLVVLFGACDKAVDPTDPLYRTWRWTQTEYKDGRVMSQSNDEFTIVTFRPDGTIRYGASGRYAACCSPNRFRRKGNILDFTDVKSILVPPVDNGDKCHVVDCLSQGDSWQILMLNATNLALKTPFGKYIYKPYP